MTAPTTRRVTNAFIGSPIERLEDLRFLTGRGQYTDDLTNEKMLHAVILRSSVAHGRIRSIDTAAARARPGVHAVITAADIGEIPTIPLRHDPLPSSKRYVQPIIAADKVRFVGEPIAVVVADSVALAEDALEAIVVDIEPLPAVVDRDAARKADVFLFEETGSNVAGTITATLGDTDTAFKECALRPPRTFQGAAPWRRADGAARACRRLGHGETARDGVRCLQGAVQQPARAGADDEAPRGIGTDAGIRRRRRFRRARRVLSGRFPDSVRGARRRPPGEVDRGPAREFDVAQPRARRRMRSRNRLQPRRRPSSRCAATPYTDLGAYMRTNGATASRNISQIMSGPYRIPHVRMDVTMVVTNKTPSGTYRGPGRFESDFCRERLFDMVAADLGIDRVEFRRRNLIAEADMPYALAKVHVLDIVSECDSGDYQMTLDRCLAEFNWAERSKLQGALIDGRYHGVAIGCYLEGGGTGPRENARLLIEADGKISVFVGSSSVGQGVETVFSQIAADALELPMERINNVFHGSTDYVTEGFGSFSSRSIVMGGNAIVDAANRLRALIRDAAAQRLGCAANEISFDNETVVGPNRATLDLKEFAGLAADGTHASNKRTYSYGAHAAYVAVDPKTGQVELIDYVAVEDVGRIVNPLTLHGQCVGAVVQGLGGALLEHFIYDENGQFLTGSFADYLMPTASDFPSIRAVALEQKPSPLNPMGTKGAGEGGIIPVGGVVANAVAAALSSLGVKLHELPLTPPRVWEMIQTARQSGAKSVLNSGFE